MVFKIIIEMDLWKNGDLDIGIMEVGGRIIIMKIIGEWIGEIVIGIGIMEIIGIFGFIIKL